MATASEGEEPPGGSDPPAADDGKKTETGMPRLLMHFPMVSGMTPVDVDLSWMSKILCLVYSWTY